VTGPDQPSTTPKSTMIIIALSITLEGSLYSAITPLLPFLTRGFELGDTVAGILVSAYSAGMVIGALMCVPVLAKINSRNVACGGLCALAASTVVFATAQLTPVLISARLGQGCPRA
jgi:predicted MFS family arabinose efflux permease